VVGWRNEVFHLRNLGMDDVSFLLIGFWSIAFFKRFALGAVPANRKNSPSAYFYSSASSPPLSKKRSFVAPSIRPGLSSLAMD
jgi:hypothetical protein